MATPTSPRPSLHSITFYVITARLKYITMTRGCSTFSMSWWKLRVVPERRLMWSADTALHGATHT